MGCLPRRFFPLAAWVFSHMLGCMKTMRESLIELADAAGPKLGMAQSTLGLRIFNNAHFFRRLRAGGNFTHKSYERALAWFGERCPELVAAAQSLKDGAAKDQKTTPPAQRRKTSGSPKIEQATTDGGATRPAGTSSRGRRTTTPSFTEK